ncbi:hypothetical protein KOW79_019167 [Hemibagrus wyckioides]|uniref:Uncharacterized protein n=1 Tax=Hemibagrus wyckioides TaxID=337641 RepID=A0A9D3N6K7_9TELE|nr:hypothetical protein KOW79_019167 [Hemibagrus wyckioides]
MLTRNIIIFCTLAVLLAEADLDAANGGLQAMSTGTDQDSTSDEAPTESMNSVSPDQPNENESPESEEVMKAALVQRAAKSQTPNQRKRSKPVMASKKRMRPLRS